MSFVSARDDCVSQVAILGQLDAEVVPDCEETYKDLFDRAVGDVVDQNLPSMLVPDRDRMRESTFNHRSAPSEEEIG